MPLTCECDYDGNGDCSWFYDQPDDYIKMDYRPMQLELPLGGRFIKPRRKKCSCGEFVEQDSMVARFNRSRPTRTGTEEQIYGDERPLSPMYFCERCSDLYFSFSELGYTCISPDENMLELAKESAIARREGVKK